MQNTAATNMVLGQIITNEVLDPAILQAMKDTPREAFVPANLRGAAYIDEDLALGSGRALMAPMTFAKLLHMAEIDATSRVLNVGCLSGYSAAVLARLCAHVVATEIDTVFAAQARAHMERIAITNVTIQEVKSLTDGYSASAPYDVVVIGGALQFIPAAIAAQIAKGGRLVAVRNVSERADTNGGLGKGMVLRRVGNLLQPRDHFDTGATLLPGFARAETFEF